MKPNPVFRILSFSPDPRDGNLWNAVVFLQKNYIYKAEHLLRTILERFTTETVIVPDPPEGCHLPDSTESIPRTMPERLTPETAIAPDVAERYMDGYRLLSPANPTPIEIPRTGSIEISLRKNRFSVPKKSRKH